MLALRPKYYFVWTLGEFYGTVIVYKVKMYFFQSLTHFILLQLTDYIKCLYYAGLFSLIASEGDKILGSAGPHNYTSDLIRNSNMRRGNNKESESGDDAAHSNQIICLLVK